MQCRHFTIRLTPQHLIEDEERLNTFLRQVRVHSIQTSLVASKGERWSVLVFFEEQAAANGARPDERENPAPASSATTEMPELTPEERQIYERLKEWRSARAKTEGVPPYVIAHNATLAQIARSHMSLAAVEDLAPIKQFGAQRAARYGAEIIQILRPRGSSDHEALFEENYTR